MRIRIGIQPKMLDPDPYQMNTDPQPWPQGQFFKSKSSSNKKKQS